MKVSCLQENLARGLGTVARAVANRSTLPVLANVLLATDNGRLRLTATNLEMGISCWIGAKIDEEGSTTAPARTLVDLVNTLPNDRVEMELVVRTQTLKIRCGSFNNDLKGIDAQEFPPLPQASEEEGVTLNVEDLKEMIAQVAFAASSDDARPVLTGVLLEIDNGQLTLAAADGFRLSVRQAHLSSPGAGKVRVIVPARALAELGRILTDGDETVTMVLPPNRGQVLFRSKNVELVSQLIEGNFPDYQGIIPTTSATRTVLPTAGLPQGLQGGRHLRPRGGPLRSSAHHPRQRTRTRPRAGLGHVGRDRVERDQCGRHGRRGRGRDRLQRPLPGRRPGCHRHAQRRPRDEYGLVAGRPAARGPGRLPARRHAHAPWAVDRPVVSGERPVLRP